MIEDEVFFCKFVERACSKEAFSKETAPAACLKLQAALRRRWRAPAFQSMLRRRSLPNKLQSHADWAKEVAGSRADDVKIHGLHPCGASGERSITAQSTFGLITNRRPPVVFRARDHGARIQVLFPLPQHPVLLRPAQRAALEGTQAGVRCWRGSASPTTHFARSRHRNSASSRTGACNNAGACTGSPRRGHPAAVRPVPAAARAWAALQITGNVRVSEQNIYQ